MPDIPPPKNEKSQPVFLIATQRSGTNYLRALLRGTGAFADFDEILHSEIDKNNPARFAYFDWSKHSYFKFRAEQIKTNPELSIPHGDTVFALFNDYLDYLSSAAGNKPFFLMDVKYKSLHHFDPVWQPLSAPKFIFELIRLRGCRVLHLVRENVFNVYLSEQVAGLTGMYVRAKGDTSELPRVRIEVEEMFRNIQRIEREINLIRLDLEKLPYVFELSYESITSGSNGMPDSIASDLRLFFRTSLQFNQEPPTQKIVRDRWSVVENAEEVKQAMRNSPYSWCLK